MKVIVYTSIIGGIDQLWSVMPGSSDVEHIAFVDAKKREVGLWGKSPPTIMPKTGNVTAPKTWEQRIVKPRWDARRAARHYKAVPHLYLPDADIWIWVDGNVRLRMHPLKLIERRMKGDLTTFTHPDRRCLYDEVAFCARVGKDKATTLREQAKRYSLDGMPRRWGLAETRVVIRRNTPEIRALNEAWWAEIERGSLRDQVSLPYVCWKQSVRWGILHGRCYSRNQSREYVYLRHTKKKK